MSYTDYERQHLRLTILRLLEEDRDRSANDSLLRDAVRPFGFSPSRDQLKTELRWLEEQGLVSIKDLDPMLVATLTERGQEAATGTVNVPGVKRPGPR